MKDTVELLKECDAGLNMAVDSLEQVLDTAQKPQFSKMLHKYYDDHNKLKEIINRKLDEYHASPKNANPLGRASSKMMTNMKLSMDNSDEKIADLMVDGCNMGIKSVSKYINQYSGAKEDIGEIANDIIRLEQNFMNDLRPYL